MDATHLLILLAAGATGGFIGGLVGVGGGVIFAPVLFFFFQGLGITDPILTPLTIGSSLFCTLVTAVVSAWFQQRKGAIDWPVVRTVGLFSVVAIAVMTQFVTTAAWYDASVFQVVFSVVLVTMGVRMLGRRSGSSVAGERAARTWQLAGIGTVAGAVSTAVGVGGGIVMVPAYHHVLGRAMHRAVGTSSATIVIVAAWGVAGYMIAGWGLTMPAGAIGYVHGVAAVLLAVPAAIGARAGVAVAHRINTTRLRRAFAVLALIVAVRLLLRAVL